jgi:UDP-N-acetyl-D-mannosaminuronic acid transferase (WecB/TagA/CpsF family)
VQKFTPDLLLISLGGGSGKQEFFIDNLKQDPKVNFRLATGIGAALDHLGTGAEQKNRLKSFKNLAWSGCIALSSFPIVVNAL